MLPRLIEYRGQFLAIDEQIRQTLLVQHLERAFQQAFRSRIGIGNPATIVQHKDSGSQQVEAAERSREYVHDDPKNPGPLSGPGVSKLMRAFQIAILID